jgi:iron complex outermembrane receptor protein
MLALHVSGNSRSLADTREGGGAKLLNSAAHQSGSSVGLGVIGARAKGGISYEWIGFNYGLPGVASDEEFGSHIRGQRHQLTARSDVSINALGLSFLQFDGTSQWYKHDEIEHTGEIGTSFGLKTQTVKATARTAFGGFTGAIGVSGLFKQYDATGEEALTPAANTKSGGVFFYEDIPLWGHDTASAPHLQFGGRYDRYAIDSKEGDAKFGAARSLQFNSMSGSVGLVVPLAPNVSLNGNLSRAFRAPTVEELFSNAIHEAAGTYDIGNPDLKAEINNGAELVLRAQRDQFHAQLSGYYNRIDNYVTADIVKDTVVDGESIPLNRYAQGDATLKGLEGMVQKEIVPHVVLGAMGDLVRGALKNGEPLPFMPPARLGMNVRYDNGVFSLGADYRHGFAQTRVPPAVSESDPSALGTDAYNLVNFSLGYNLIQHGFVHAFTLQIENAFDAKYKDATSRIKTFAFNPGRNVSLVYKVLF